MAQRTIKQKNDIRFNYFNVLKLDEKVTDKAVIEQAIDAKIKYWQKKNDNDFIKLKDDIRAVMLDPTLRAQEASEFKKYKALAESAVKRAIYKYASLGTVDSIQFDNLARETKQTQNKDYLMGILKSEGVGYIDFSKEFNIPAIDDIPKFIEAEGKLQASKDLLKPVMGDVNDFFTFYNAPIDGTKPTKTISVNSTAQEINDKKTEFYGMLNGKRGAQGAIYEEIENIRKAFIVMMKPEYLKFYSKYSKLFALKSKVELAINENDYTRILGDAKSLCPSLDQKSIELFVRYLYSDSGSNIPIAKKRNFVACPSCENFYDKDKHKTNCPICGAELGWTCKLCGTKNKDGEICTGCKVGKKSYERFQIIVESIKALVASSKYAEAKVKIAEAKAYTDVVKYLNSKGKSDLTRQEEQIDFELEYTSILNSFSVANFNEITTIPNAQRFVSKYTNNSSIQNAQSKLNDINKLLKEYEKAFKCSCGHIIKSPDVQICPKCGSKLAGVCWNCKKSINTIKSEVCPNCRATPAQETAFMNSIRDIRKLLSAPTLEVERINSSIDVLTKQYRTQALAGTNIYNMINDVKADFNDLKDAYTKYVLKIQDCISHKKFYEAQGYLNRLKQSAPTYDASSLEKTIKEKINNAVRGVNDFNQETNVNLALSKAEAVLLDCIDCTDAEQFIKSHKISPPRNLSVTLENGCAIGKWLIALDKDASITVIRKQGSEPQNYRDGEVIATNLRINSFKDTSIPSAVNVYYGVYATKKYVNGTIVINSPLVVTDDSVVSLPDVSNVNQVFEGKDGISVTYSAPQNATVVVYKKDGSVAPKSDKDGTPVRTLSKDGFDDATASGVTSYLILCKYNLDGKQYFSKGVSITYQRLVQVAPVSIRNVRELNGIDFEVTLNQTKNTIEFYGCEAKTEFNYSAQEKKIDFSRICGKLKRLDVQVNNNNTYTVRMPSNTSYWVYPIASNDMIFRIGPPVLMNTILGFDSINVVTQKNNVKIECNINPQVRNVIVIVDGQKHYDTLVNVENKRVFTKEQILNNGGISLSLPPAKHYITLFAEFINAGESSYSKAKKLDPVVIGERVTVRYEMKYDVSVSGKYKLKVDFSIEDEDKLLSVNNKLPSMVVVIGCPIPMTKNDGVEIAQIPEVVMKKKLFKKGLYGSCEVELPPADNKRAGLIIDFINEGATNIQLKGSRK